MHTFDTFILHLDHKVVNSNNCNTYFKKIVTSEDRFDGSQRLGLAEVSADYFLKTVEMMIG